MLVFDPSLAKRLAAGAPRVVSDRAFRIRSGFIGAMGVCLCAFPVERHETSTQHHPECPAHHVIESMVRAFAAESSGLLIHDPERIQHDCVELERLDRNLLEACRSAAFTLATHHKLADHITNDIEATLVRLALRGRGRRRMPPFTTRQRAVLSDAKTEHGHTGGHRGKFSPTYYSWTSMLTRCTNPHIASYRHYGGRGITVCDGWRKFTQFLADMGERPAGTSLDRINNDGNYEPGNCRWATTDEQSRNRRSSKLEPHEPAQIRWLVGLGYRRIDIARFFDVHPTTVYDVLHRRSWP